YNTERSLKMLVGKRRRLLDYLIRIDISRYRTIIKELGVRK
ncbi:MAG: 30S ribosomal protein S15, partial [Tannerella sp.]|nr:30S ribosomal protein S15 [Tannerella sp.]